MKMGLTKEEIGFKKNKRFYLLISLCLTLMWAVQSVQYGIFGGTLFIILFIPIMIVTAFLLAKYVDPWLNKDGK